MTDDIKLAQATARAARAKALLEDDLLKEAFSKLKDAYVTAWCNSEARDDDGRQRLWQAVNVLGKIRDHLTNVVTNGKIAQAELDALAGRQSDG